MTGNFTHLTLAFGLLGNVVLFMVFLAPIVYKKKSTLGFQSVPYVVGLFSAMLWIYYALLKTNAMLLITINSMESVKLIVLLIVVGFGLILVLTQFLASGANRAVIVRWICLVFSLCVFVAPLSVLRQVIKTKSVEYMPILLSLALTLRAVMWFFYGLLLGDFNIAIPNVCGFTFGIIQMILYFVYKNKKLVSDEKVSDFREKISEMEEQKVPKMTEQKIIDVVKLSALMSSDIPPVVAKLNKNGDEDCLVIEAQASRNMPKHTIEVRT